eukprot:TRINITY_DN3261_c0_g1_i1.p3 TRINITY_DN3261_c0_g1~~TRINITY_DN3261_c0_g1_i1.p3  ORF type:complete len:97 (-),score=31.81 TRINITY_DN3261_c0_g1_i1:1363-1632(-)
MDDDDDDDDLEAEVSQLAVVVETIGEINFDGVIQKLCDKLNAEEQLFSASSPSPSSALPAATHLIKIAKNSSIVIRSFLPKDVTTKLFI